MMIKCIRFTLNQIQLSGFLNSVVSWEKMPGQYAKTMKSFTILYLGPWNIFLRIHVELHRHALEMRADVVLLSYGGNSHLELERDPYSLISAPISMLEECPVFAEGMWLSLDGSSWLLRPSHACMGMSSHSWLVLTREARGMEIPAGHVSYTRAACLTLSLEVSSWKPTDVPEGKQQKIILVIYRTQIL